MGDPAADYFCGGLGPEGWEAPAGFWPHIGFGQDPPTLADRTGTALWTLTLEAANMILMASVMPSVPLYTAQGSGPGATQPGSQEKACLG